MKNLFRFIEGQTHFSTSCHAQVSLTVNELNKNFPTYLLPPSMHQKLTDSARCCMQTNQLLTESYVELEDNCNAVC